MFTNAACQLVLLLAPYHILNSKEIVGQPPTYDLLLHEQQSAQPLNYLRLELFVNAIL